MAKRYELFGRTTNTITRPDQDHFEKDLDQILFFNKYLDQDPFQITSEKRDLELDHRSKDLDLDHEQVCNFGSILDHF